MQTTQSDLWQQVMPAPEDSPQHQLLLEFIARTEQSDESDQTAE